MASIGIMASLQRTHSSHYGSKKQSHQTSRARSLGTKQESHVIPSNFEGHKSLTLTRKEENLFSLADKSIQPPMDEMQHTAEAKPSAPNFFDQLWKNGTWDLNMFVKKGKMDWDAVIVAEAQRRKFLDQYPEAATNQEPVLFRSSVIPWWAGMAHSHLPEAELLNGRAAMVGFFTAYFIDALTRLDVVGQTGNVLCKAAVFVTIIGVVLFRRREDFGNLKKLSDEATYYDRQWQHQDARSGASEQGRTKM